MRVSRGDFVLTARLDGVDFAGLASSQARVGLLFTPDFTQTGTNFIYGGTMVVGDGTLRRTDRIAVGNSATSNINVTGTRCAVSEAHAYRQQLSGRVFTGRRRNVHERSARTFTAGTAADAVRRLCRQLEQQHQHQRSRRRSATCTCGTRPATSIIGPNEFTGDIGSGTRRRWRRTDAAADRPDASRGPVARRDTAANLRCCQGDVARYNIEGYAAGAVTGGGNIPRAILVIER